MKHRWRAQADVAKTATLTVPILKIPGRQSRVMGWEGERRWSKYSGDVMKPIGSS